MEQQLINAFMKLISKAGGGSLIKDLIQQVDEDGNPKTWTVSELERAVKLVLWQTENFGTADARAIIETLMKKYNLTAEDCGKKDESLPEEIGAQGLQ
jgi:hypothetical protein